MALTDTTIRSAKPKATQYKLHDEKGLFAIVRPTGGKLWRFKYRYLGKEQQLSLGTYPEVSLKEARQRRDDARQMLAEGKSPGAEKKRAKL
ncbi:MAG: Arm DNA-binding domain-containing protein, partial [Burkholderiaceae bacterium]|nr:Arm DNA-binding domain-containing protein [Burkholderiaceae bacterium]